VPIGNFGAAPTRAQMAIEKRKNKKLSWTAYCVCGQKDMLFLNLRMYDKPPSSTDGVQAAEKQIHTQEEFSIKQVREHDLLILSEDPIDLRGQNDIKQVVSADFLRAHLLKHNAMFAFVTKKAQRDSFVNMYVDISKAYFLDKMETDNIFIKLNCYLFDNLATTVREFKTLKMSEFYRMSPILLMPSLALENKEKMLLDNKNMLEAALGSFEKEKKES
jgi:hypothetical protein